MVDVLHHWDCLVCLSRVHNGWLLDNICGPHGPIAASYPEARDQKETNEEECSCEGVDVIIVVIHQSKLGKQVMPMIELI